MPKHAPLPGGQVHSLEVHEGAPVVDKVAGPPSEPKTTYEVLKPVFKHGREYVPGEPILLDPVTASRFIDLGEIKECST